MDWLADDLYPFFIYADDFFRGLIPYKDYSLEYPPGAFLALAFPRLLTANILFYILIFSFLMATLFFAQVNLLLKRQKKISKTWLFFLIFPGALILPLSSMRLDLVPTILTFWAVILLLKNSSFWPEFFLALGTITKIFPALLLPFFVFYFRQAGGKERAIKGMGVYFLTLVIFLFPFILAGGGEGFWDIFSYQLARPVEIESLPASLLFLGSLLDSPARSFHDFSSWNISVPDWDKPVTGIFVLFGVTSLILTYFWFYRWTKREASASRREFILVKAVLAILLIFIAFNKVFSPQYLIWLWPFVLWFFLFLSRKKMIILGSLWGLILFLTLVNLIKFWELVAFSQPVIFSQIFRNLLYLVFLGSVLKTSIEDSSNFESQEKR